MIGQRLRVTTIFAARIATALFWGGACTALAGNTPPPDWVMSAAHAATPTYPGDTRAVVLDDDETLTVQPDGKSAIHVRRVVKILRQQGRDFGTILVHLDKERKLRSLHAWSIGPDGHTYTVKDSDFMELGAGYEDILYDDLHVKRASAPAADPGAVVAYEYDRLERPYFSEYTWQYQESVPTLHSSFELDLPAGWKYYTAARSHDLAAPAEVAPNHFRWQVSKQPGIDVKDIPMTPDPETMAGRMVVHYSAGALPQGEARWAAIGDWYSELAGPRGTTTADIAAQAQSLTAGTTDFTVKLQRITEYMQQNIRYVGIEIGIGGWQPHAADDIFRNRYGDCKDKVTLLRAMLDAIGIHATWVLVDSRRGFVDPEMPSVNGDHAIAAIELPANYTDPRLQALVTEKNGKRYLIFDPTDEYTPVGQISPELQASYGILAAGKQSELIKIPQLTPDADLLDRVVRCKLLPDGSLEAAVTENRRGDISNYTRMLFAGRTEKQQREAMERFLRRDFVNFQLDTPKAQNQSKLDQQLIVDYNVTVPEYARAAGNLLLFRPRILGTYALALKDEPRNYPVELGAIRTRRDRFDVTLPAGYVVDELPDPLDLDTDFASYHSSVRVDGATLHYTREYVVKQLVLDAARYKELRTFSERVAYDEASTAVLKKQ